MKLSILVSTAALAAALAVPAHAVELIVNGGFEMPVVTGPGGYDYRTGSSLTGWTYAGGHNGAVQFNASYAPGSATVGAGAQSVQIEYPGDSIQQTFATTLGQGYLLSFMLSAYAPSPSSLQVSVGPVSAAFGGSYPNYVTYTLPFVANAAQTTLTFTNAGALTTYPHIDSVSVAAVPEPETYALLLAGLGVVAWLGRRRQARGAAA